MSIIVDTIGDGLWLALRAVRRNWENDDEKRRLGAGLDTKALEEKTLDILKAAQFPTMSEAMDAGYKRLATEVIGRDLPVPTYRLRTDMLTVFGNLYKAEGFNLTPLAEVISGEIQAARYRDRLLELSYKASDPGHTVEVFTKTIIDAYLKLCASLPKLAQETDDENEEEDEDALVYVPFLDILPDPGKMLTNLIEAFFHPDVVALNLFSTLQTQLLNNQKNAPGKQSDKAYPTPDTFKGTPQELIDTFLKGTELHRIFKTTVPFKIPNETRFAGTWVIAPSGRGKTNLLRHMILEDLQRPGSIILMDSKGDLIDALRNLKLPKETVIIDPQPFLALNPLDIEGHSVELLEYVFSSLLEAQMTALQATLFRAVLQACVQVIPNPTMETFRDIIVNGPAKYDEYIKKLRPDLQDFFYNELPTATYRDTRQQLQWRLRLLMGNDIIHSMFSAPTTKLKLGELMDGGKLIIINNSKALLGEFGSEFFGRVFIALVLAAAQQRATRPQAERVPVFFYIDECHTVIARDQKIATILDECRSQKIALTLAHQRIAQITSPNVLDALQNCAIRFANSDDDAPHLAASLHTEPAHLRDLPKGSFAVFVRDTTKAAVTLKIPLTALPFPRMSQGEEDTLKARMRASYCYSDAPTRAPEPEPVSALNPSVQGPKW